MIKLINGDCLEELKKIEDKSVNLILIDPPYNIKKAKWDSWKTVEAYVEFMGKVFKELERVLKDNGSFYFFHNDFLQVAELQCWIRQNTKFVFKSFITINKLDNNYVKDLYGNCEHFRNYLNFNEYALFYTFYGENEERKEMRKALTKGDYSEIMNYLKEERLKLGWNYSQIDNFLGRKKIYCYFDKPTSHEYRLISKENYEKLQTTGYYQKPYKELKERYNELWASNKHLINDFKKTRYIFNETKGRETVWAYKFREEKKTVHPTQKPVKLLEDIVHIM